MTLRRTARSVAAVKNLATPAPVRSMSTVRRPNPKQALNSILRCKTREEAEARMTELLARAWQAGSVAGSTEEGDFHGDIEPIRVARNPYR